MSIMSILNIFRKRKADENDGEAGASCAAERFTVDCEAMEAVHCWKGTEEQVFQKECLTGELVSDWIEAVLKGNSTQLVIDYIFQGEGMYVKKLKKHIYTPYHCYLILHHVKDKLACLFVDGNKKTWLYVDQ